MPSSVSESFEEQYDEIKTIVLNAKEAREDMNYRDAKNYFLDAASKSLELSKKADSIEEVTFRNIARMLIDSAKEMKQLIDIKSKPLPSIPTKNLKKVGNTITSYPSANPPKAPSMRKKTKDQDNDDINPVLLQLMIIQGSGIPIFTWTSKVLSDNTQMKINDILFSGAITAVNSLISEVLSKPIQSIQFEDGNIVLKFIDNVIFVIFVESDPVHVEPQIDKFSKTFMEELLPRYEADVKRGMALNSNEEILDSLITCFNLK